MQTERKTEHVTVMIPEGYNPDETETSEQALEEFEKLRRQMPLQIIQRQNTATPFVLNGIPINEGDVLRYTRYKETFIHIVCFGEYADAEQYSDFKHFGYYVADKNGNQRRTLPDVLELNPERLGNIHETPELSNQLTF